MRDSYPHAVATGTRHIFLVGSLFAVAGFVAGVFVKETPLRPKLADTEPEPPLPPKTSDATTAVEA
jgi:hypothetical protein